MQSLMILGRQPELGLAELESLLGAAAVRPLKAADGQVTAALLDVDPCLVPFDRLGGSLKFCKVLTTVNSVRWRDIEALLIKTAPAQAAKMPAGKMHLGLSLYGYNESIKQITAGGLKLKKAIRRADPTRSVRLVPNQTTELNSAQVKHHRLTGDNGWELVIVRDDLQTIVAQTVKVQDIDAYAHRDRSRPARDAKVGMLPPKLAQIIINLAAGRLPEAALQSICDIPADQSLPPALLNQTVLDPFCGTGVVLQEALLMGYSAYGTDLEPRMIDYSRKNLDWLTNQPPLSYRPADSTAAPETRLETGDATNHHWQPPIDIVAAEGYLGRPFTAQPSPEILAQTMAECNLIIKKSLQNLATQLQPGTRLCLAIPAWQTNRQMPSGGSNSGINSFKRLPLVDQIADLGYTVQSFQHAGGAPLVYHRPNQVVARELLVITRK